MSAKPAASKAANSNAAQDAASLPPEANPDKVQGRASNPLDSVWVGASAGTGKTKVLTDRVLRLLLPRPDGTPGTPPHRILCITFTKAAAAQMAIRINEVLGKWATVDDATLRAHLEKLTAGAVDDALMTAARRLFAAVVDTPGGMKILTIHAFCQSILRRFPLEAGLPPHFEVMDELSARETLRGAQEHTLEAARRKQDSPLGRAMTQLTGTVTDPDQFTALMAQITGERSLLKRLIHTRGDGDPGTAQLIADVYNRVGARMRETVAEIVQDACRDTAFMGADLQLAADALSGGTPKTDQPKADLIHQWLAADIRARSAMFDAYTGVFLKKDGQPFAESTMATKSVRESVPDLLDIMQEEAQRLVNVRQKINALNVAKNTEALLRVGADILRHYEARKRAAALLDYDDLIFTTLALLEKSDTIAQWVLFKLDGGLDHLLIDEAQDTNPEQWEIAKRLSDAFWEGLGQHEATQRTIFVVGDDKQSIYSFQRADPAKFVEMRDYFARRLADMGSALKRVPMQMSFRSTSAVLNMVDACFAGDAARGVDFSGDAIRHFAWRAGQAGRVELWPPVCPPDPPPLMQWALPVAAMESGDTADDARTKLAKGIAARIAEWLATGEILKSKGRKIRPSDVMILVRSRAGGFVEQMVRALKSLDVPVSGVDRMVLTEQLAVMDVLVLADFLLLERDDLSLATILKSPLIGMDDDDLMALALGREGSLWRALLAAEDDRHRRAADYLRALVDHAATDRPYEFFARVLSAPCPADALSGRRAVMGRLGLDAIDPLDELLNKALEFEASHAPSLQGFVAWLRAGSSEIKRELEQGELDEVRIMTVHGAKGLQAPIVFLPDTMSPPAGHSRNRDTLLWPRREDDVPLWAQRMAEADPVYTTRREAADQRTAEEYRRLFYVALTRAEDRLYIGGWINKRGGIPSGCWYDLAAQGMTNLGDLVVEEDFKLAGRDVLDRDGEIQPVRIYDVAQTAETESDKDETGPAPAALGLPGWARSLPGDEPTPPVPLAPSRPAVVEQAVFSPLRRDDSDIRWKRGTLVHQLLQLLPDLPPDSRDAACRAFLARPGHALNKDQQDAMAAETLRVLQHAEFAPIFGPGSMAEVPVSGLVGKNRADKFSLSGQIDRLLVTDDDILIVDYKTNRPPPRIEADVSTAYLKQMAAYRAVISDIWPDRDVRCALLWTDGPFLMPLSAQILDTHAP